MGGTLWRAAAFGEEELSKVFRMSRSNTWNPGCRKGCEVESLNRKQHSALFLVVVDVRVSRDDDPLLDPGLGHASLHRLCDVCGGGGAAGL